MSTANHDAERSVDPAQRVNRLIWWLRPFVLLVAGLVIAFSAELHVHLIFDRLVIAIALLILGATHIIEWRAQASGHAGRRNPVALLLAAAAIVSAVLVLLVDAAVGFALIIAVWALVTGLLEFLATMLGYSARVDGLVYGALGVLLSILTLLVMTDIIAVTGFFGAYAVIFGVYLAISVFDARSRDKRERTSVGAGSDTHDDEHTHSPDAGLTR